MTDKTLQPVATTSRVFLAISVDFGRSRGHGNVLILFNFSIFLRTWRVKFRISPSPPLGSVFCHRASPDLIGLSRSGQEPALVVASSTDSPEAKIPSPRTTKCFSAEVWRLASKAKHPRIPRECCIECKICCYWRSSCAVSA